MTVAPPPSTLLFDAEDFAAYQGSRQSSNIYNRRRQEVNQKLEELGRRLLARPVGAQLVGAGLERGLSDPHPSLRNQHRVTAQWLYFLRPESERALLESQVGRVQPLSALVEDPSPLHQHLALTLRVDGNGLTAQLELPPNATVDRRNWLAGAREPGGEESLADLFGVLASVGFRLVVGDGAPEPLLPARFIEALAPERPPRVEIALRLSPAGDPTEAAAQALLALVPLYRFAAWSDHNDRLGLHAAIEDAREAARALAERVGVEEQERARLRREQQETARQRALREGTTRSVLEPRRRDADSSDRRHDDHAGRGHAAGPEERLQAAGADASPAPATAAASEAHAAAPGRAPAEPPGRRDDASRGRTPRDGGRRDARGGPDAGRPDTRRGPDAGRPDTRRGPDAGRPDTRRGPDAGRPDTRQGSDAGRPDTRRDDARPRPTESRPAAVGRRPDERPDRRDDRRDRGPRRDGAPVRRKPLPDASAPSLPVDAGDEVVIVGGLFTGKVAVVLGTATDGAIELTVGNLRMTLAFDQVRKIV